MHASNSCEVSTNKNITEVFKLNLSSQDGQHSPMPNIIINYN